MKLNQIDQNPPILNNCHLQLTCLDKGTSEKAYLEDVWNTEIEFDEQRKSLIWKPSSSLRLILKPNIKIVETRHVYNPTCSNQSFSDKLLQFQNMWMPDQHSWTFFSCMHHHLKRQTTKCDSFCSVFSTPYCGELAVFLSTNNWPTSTLGTA